MMIRQNKGKLIISSLIILLPWITGMGKDSFLGNISPLFLLAIHWVCVLFTICDPKNKRQNKKVIGLVFWICPLLSVVIYLLDRAIAAGKEFTIEVFTSVGIGLMFAVIGNYLPKCKQNYTIGIKIPWTLHDEENWNKTHRIGGRLWLFGGVLIIVSAFLPDKIANTLIPAVMLIMVVVPIVFSYLYSRKQKLAGTFGTRAADMETKEMMQKNKKITKIGIAIVILIFAACGVLMFSGSISFVCDEDELEIEASYWNDLEISYHDIESLDLRQEGVSGSRVGGFGSARLLMGNFKNEEFGYYTRYTYTGKGACIVMTVDGRTVVLGCENSQKTEALYEELLECVQHLSQ